MRTLHRLFLVAPLLAGAAWAGIGAVQTARADRLLADASREISSLSAAERLTPFDPIVHELHGLLLLKTEGAENLKEAESRFTRALMLRPISPYAWASLAETKYRQGDTRQVFEVALVRAAELGAAEPQVQRTVAFYGLAVRDEVGPATRAAIDRIVGNGMRRDPSEMLQIAQRRGRLSTACRHLSGSARQPDAKWLKTCQSSEGK